jgi:hypothetical protein
VRELRPEGSCSRGKSSTRVAGGSDPMVARELQPAGCSPLVESEEAAPQRGVAALGPQPEGGARGSSVVAAA